MENTVIRWFYREKIFLNTHDVSRNNFNAESTSLWTTLLSLVVSCTSSNSFSTTPGLGPTSHPSLFFSLDPNSQIVSSVLTGIDFFTQVTLKQDRRRRLNKTKWVSSNLLEISLNTTRKILGHDICLVFSGKKVRPTGKLVHINIFLFY